jgi:hypothetical protein
MLALSMGLLFTAYAAGLFAYCLLRGYNITPLDMFHSSWPAKKAAG